MSPIEDFAEAIAIRIADEWSGSEDFSEDANLLQEILQKLLTMHPEECLRLIGTGFIEEDYFSIIQD